MSLGPILGVIILFYVLLKELSQFFPNHKIVSHPIFVAKLLRYLLRLPALFNLYQERLVIAESNA